MGWQSALSGGSNPISSADAYLHDGEGRRVAQALTTGGSTTVKTRYVLGLEEQTGDVSKQPITKYESVPGVCDVVIVGSGSTESISYVTTDGLGSVSEALDGNGDVLAQQLYGPYGGVRYSSGTMPTSAGATLWRPIPPPPGRARGGPARRHAPAPHRRASRP